MLSINGVSLTSHVNDWLSSSRHPGILHLFDHVCNLINERKEVLSMVTPQIGNGPFNLVIEREMLFTEKLTIDSPVSMYTGQLNVGNITVRTDAAKTWNPRPDWETLHARRADILNQLTQLPIANYQSTASSLSHALANRDLSAVLTTTEQLAGLGNGLTPAGDDFIVGSLLATWIIHPTESARVLAEEVASTAGPLTTSLSAAWLRSAGRGEAGSLWHEFFNALLLADSVGNQKAMDEILAVGETSGADAMAGFIDLFVYWGEHCSNL